MSHDPLKDDEKDGTRRKKPRERQAIQAYQAAGWETMTRGMPTFMARKRGQPVRFIFAGRVNLRPSKAGLTIAQAKIASLLRTLGLDVRVVDWGALEGRNPCDPDGPRGQVPRT